MNQKGYRNLVAFQKAEELVIEIYRLSAKFPKEEVFGLASQIKRAVISVPANIAEGYRRAGAKDKVRFLNIAQGSLVEVECFLGLAEKLSFLTFKDLKKALELKEETGKTLFGLIKAISNDLVSESRSL